MLDLNTDRAINAIGMLIVGALFLTFSLGAFGKGSDNFFTQIVGGAEGHVIEYDLNNGKGDFTRTVIDYEDNEYTVPDKEPTRASYIFTGWVNSSDDVTYYPGSTITVDEDIVLKAKWQAATHDITYDLNGGRGNITNVKVAFDEEFRLTETLPEREGQHLVGWESSVDGVVYQPNEVVEITGPTTFKAVWSTNTYSVNYDVNGGSATDSYPESEIEHNKHFTISTVRPTRTGYVFHGWKNSATGDVYDAGDNFQVQDDTTLTAQWNESNHRIRYDLSGGIYNGDDTPALTQYGNYNELHQTPTVKPTRTGYVFNGWNNNRDEQTYQAGTGFLVQGDTELIASWSPSTYRVTFDLDGGSGSFTPSTREHNKDFKIPSDKPTKYGYTFNGWVNSQDNKVYQPNETITVHDNTVLTAQWVSDTFEVVFELNGGSGTFDNGVANYNSDFYITERIPQYDGQNFQGWLSSHDNKIHQPGDEIRVTGTVTLTAQWDTNDYSVTYDTNGGNGSYTTANIAHGRNHVISTVKPTRAGYRLVGWTNSADDKTYQPGDTIRITENTKLTAEWALNEYTVSYYLNGGKGSHQSEQVRHGEFYAVDSEAPTRSGYMFVGWRNNKDNRLYNGGEEMSVTSDVQLSAEWKLTGHDVTYQLDGGEGSKQFDTPQTIDYNKSHTVFNEVPTKVGHVFKGWKNSVNEQIYEPGSSITVREDITLTAQWAKGDYTIKFDFNGGTVDDLSEFKEQVWTHDSSFTLSNQTPQLSNSNVEFQGWLDPQDGLIYQPGEQYTMIEDTTLVAQWGYGTYTIEYDENGGNIDYQNGQREQFFEVTTEDGHTVVHAPTKENHVFGGWKSDVDGTVYQPGDKMIPSRDMKLTAVWKLKEYNLSYDLTGGSGNFTTKRVKHGDSTQVPTSTPTRTGYSFTGWVRQDNGQMVYPGDSITLTDDVHLQAKWAVNEYTIQYSIAGADNVDKFQTVTVKHGDVFTIPETMPVQYGKKFRVWMNSQDGRTYQPGESFRVTGNVRLSGQWSQIAVYVTFDLNGGSGSFPIEKSYYNSDYQLPTQTPTREGHTFAGWKRSDNGEVLKAGSTFRIYERMTVTAQWDVDDKTVSYDLNSGSGSFNNSTVKYGSQYRISSGTPTREGYAFTGWKRSDNGAVVQAGGTFSVTDHVTLTAQWKTNTYFVKYDGNGGSGGTTVNVNHGGTHSVRSAPTRTGYDFLGWKNSVDGKLYAPNNSLIITGNTTLTAQWKVQTYTVSYNANGGTGAPQSQTRNYGETLSVTASVPKRDGYRFDGWTTNANGSGTKYQPGSSYTSNTSRTLYAQWVKRERFRLHLGEMKQAGTHTSSAYGFGGITGIHLIKGVDYNFETRGYVDQRAIDDGKYFRPYLYDPSWDTPSVINNHRNTSGNYLNSTFTAPYTGEYRTSGYLYPSGGSRAGKATWQNANLFLLHPDRDNETNNGYTYVDAGTSITLPEPMMSKTNYEFAGWKVRQTGAMYQPGDKVAITERLQFDAQWNPTTRKVTYNMNGGSGGPGNTTGNYGSKFKVSTTKPTRTHYDFAHWSKSGSGGGTVNAGGTFTLTGDTTLTAQWTPKSYRITYDKNGGSGGPGNTSAKYNSTFKVSTSKPTRSWYTFKNWSKSGSGGGSVSAGGSFKVTGNTTLKAQWNKKYYTVKSGDTLSAIGVRHGMGSAGYFELADKNGISVNSILSIGQRIWVP